MKKADALKVMLLFGFVSLLGDVVYEAARSINGQYLQILGANATLIGLIVGFGEFFGYALRLLSGYFSDKSKAYWFFTIFGYALLISIPLLSLAGIWQIAAILIISERIGKAIRTPARDTLISNAAKTLGTGIGFGIHEFFDQIGALLGPLLIAFLFLSSAENSKLEYKNAYSLLWLPFILLMMILIATFFIYKNLQKNKEFYIKSKDKNSKKFSKIFFYYLTFTFLTTLGFINFAIFGYHFKVKNFLSDAEIPLLYSIAMIVDAFTALSIGKFYDFLKEKMKNEKAGLLTLIFIPLLTLLIPLLIFSEDIKFILFGVILWGIILGTHETIMKAAIADISSIEKRGTAYGIFTTIYGIATLLSGIITGLLYDYAFSLLLLIIFITQFSAILIFLFIKREIAMD